MKKITAQELKTASEMVALSKLYNELIMEVSIKVPGETRHQTAKRLIRERQSQCHGPCQTKEL